MNNEIKKIIDTYKDTDNECTSAPYWLILDPCQNMDCNVHAMANRISGPFFNREDAQRYLSCKRHNFTKRAVVYCLSGHMSNKWYNFAKTLGKV